MSIDRLLFVKSTNKEVNLAVRRVFGFEDRIRIDDFLGRFLKLPYMFLKKFRRKFKLKESLMQIKNDTFILVDPKNISIGK